MDLAALLAEPLDGRFRAFRDTRRPATLASAGEQGWNVARGDLPLPLLVLDDAALEHNLRTMHGWCDERGLSLAPHGKTTMAPQLFRRQLAAGAWGMTAATVQQAAVMHAAGAQRVLLANERVGPAEVGWLARLQRDGLTAYVLVDSQRGVQLLDAALAAAGADRPLRVLLELGAPGTRAGCRSDDAGRAGGAG